MVVNWLLIKYKKKHSLCDQISHYIFNCDKWYTAVNKNSAFNAHVFWLVNKNIAIMHPFRS